MTADPTPGVDIWTASERWRAQDRLEKARLSVAHDPAVTDWEGTGSPEDRYVAGARRKELSRLTTCQREGWGTNWDATTHEVACNLQELANAPWNSYTLQQAMQDALNHAPRDEKFGPREHERKWISARQTVAGKARRCPQNLGTHTTPVQAVDFPDPTPAGNDDAASEVPAVGVTRLGKLVALERERLWVQREAKRQLLTAEQSATDPDPFDVGTLEELAARDTEDDPPPRIGGLLPAGGRATLVAARKAGKTTATLNLARCLLTGEEFLGVFPVRALEPTERVGILNYEVSGRQLRRWLEDIGVDGDRVWLANLRGRRNPLAADEDRAWLAATLRNYSVGFLIVDVFGRAFTGTNQDSNSEVAPFLAGVVDRLLHDAEVPEAVLTVHAGWAGDRSRGASALEDWPDAIWKLVTNKNNPDNPARFFSAIGRDVDVPEQAVTFDAATRSLRLSGEGSRRASAEVARHAALLTELMPLVHAIPDLCVSDLETRYRMTLPVGQPRPRNGAVGKALKYGVGTGQLRVRPGERGRQHYTATGDSS